MIRMNIKFRYLFLIVFSANLFITCECAVVNGEAISKRSKLSKHPKLVVLSYDGFRYDYMEKTDTPTLDRLKAQGVHTPYMKSQFTTKTFPNHQSMATGLHTENHGIMDNQVYDPEHGQLSGYEPFNLQFWNFRSDVSPVWIHNQLAGDGRYSGASWPGSNHPYGESETYPAHYLTYNKSLSFTARVDYIIDWLTDEEKPANLVFMYFDEPDGKGHMYGPESPEVMEQIQRMDLITNYLLSRLNDEGIDQDVSLIILSDHGFQEVSLQNMVNITALVNMSLLEDPYVGTPLSQFRPKDEENIELVYQSLKVSSNTLNFSVYKKEELPEEWHFGDNRRIMPIVVLADLGFVFDDYVDRMMASAQKLNKTINQDQKFGVHGYDNNAESMRAFFLAYGPIFKKGVEIAPFENVDLFPLVCEIMGISPPPNNGTLDIIGGALETFVPTTPSSSISISISIFNPLLSLLYMGMSVSFSNLLMQGLS